MSAAGFDQRNGLHWRRRLPAILARGRQISRELTDFAAEIRRRLAEIDRDFPDDGAPA